jgi:ankyrin repeat protein
MANSIAIQRCPAMAGATVAKPRFGRGAEDLFRAIEDSDVTTLRACLAAGVSVESRDEEGRTPLMLAALRGHETCYDELRGAGASLTARDRQGVQALVYVQNFGALPRKKVLALRASMLRSLLKLRNETLVDADVKAVVDR